MKRYILRLIAFATGAALCGFSQFSAHATATASSQLSFSNLSITPDIGTLVFLTSWTSSAYAQATTTTAFDSGGGPRVADATGDYSTAHGETIVTTPLGLNVSGQGSASANVPGQLVASDDTAGRGGMNSQFMITGGSGPVNTLFSAQLNGSLNLFTDNYGESAQAETIFSLEVDGSPVLFNDQFFSIGPSDSAGTSFSTGVNQSVQLQ